MDEKTLLRPRTAVLAALAAYAVFLIANLGALPSGSDNSGYFNEARLLSHLHLRVQARALEDVSPASAPPFLYAPLGFKPAGADPGALVATYPPGFPILLAAAALLSGWDGAGNLVLAVHALAGLLLAYSLGRRCGLSAGWAVFGAALLAASPLYIFTSLQAFSDVPATTWALAAVLAAWRGRESDRWAVAAGAAFSVALLVRPSNFLLAAPIVVAFGLSPRRWALAVAGALPGVAALAGINHGAYGSALESGYGAIWNEFHASLVRVSLRHYAHWLPLLFGPVLVAAPLSLLVRGAPRRWIAILAVWVCAFVAFYAPYRWTHEDWWFLRFLLPAAPAMVVAAVVCIQYCFNRLRASAPAAVLSTGAALLVVSTLGAEVTQVLFLDAWRVGRGEYRYERACRWVASHAPRGSVVVASQCSGALFYYTDLVILRGDQIDPETSRRLAASLRKSGKPVYAVVFGFEENLIGRLPLRWGVVARFDEVAVFRGDWPAR